MAYKVTVNWPGSSQFYAESNAIIHDTIEDALVDVKNALTISRLSTTSRGKAIIMVQEVDY